MRANKRLFGSELDNFICLIVTADNDLVPGSKHLDWRSRQPPDSDSTLAAVGVLLGCGGAVEADVLLLCETEHTQHNYSAYLSCDKPPGPWGASHSPCPLCSVRIVMLGAS